MPDSLPPPLPSPRTSFTKRLNKWTYRALLLLAVIVGPCTITLVILQVTGLIQPFTLPTGSMAPAISPGDQVYMESLTYLTNKPKAGDIVIFKSDGIPSLQGHERYAKRLVGLPGDRLRLTKGILYVNDHPVSFHNQVGEIHYTHIRIGKYLVDDGDIFDVPAGQYFVLGDNSPNSADSRFWGCIPAQSILGRAVFCYFPLKRMGPTR